MVQEHWVQRGGVELHYLVSAEGSQLTPLVYIPGSLGNAEDFRDEMARLAPRPSFAVSHRGVGKSSAPERGYSFGDHVADLEAVLDHLALGPACIMAFSLGVAIALGYAVRHPEQLAGLVLLDYPARYRVRSEAWVEQALPFARGRGIPEHVVRQLSAESEAVELWNDLSVITCPVLIVKGGQSPSLSDEDLERYRSALPQAQIEVVEDSGHEIYKPDYERFMRLVERFLSRLDEAL